MCWHSAPDHIRHVLYNKCIFMQQQCSWLLNKSSQKCFYSWTFEPYWVHLYVSCLLQIISYWILHLCMYSYLYFCATENLISRCCPSRGACSYRQNLSWCEWFHTTITMSLILQQYNHNDTFFCDNQGNLKGFFDFGQKKYRNITFVVPFIWKIIKLNISIHNLTWMSFYFKIKLWIVNCEHHKLYHNRI